VGRAPSLLVMLWQFFLTTEEKARKTSVRVVEKCPDIPVAAVQYTFTNKQHTEQHNDTYITLNIYIYIHTHTHTHTRVYIQCNQNVSVHLMITLHRTGKNILNNFNNLP
jgi:hypothetical protein